MPLIRNSQLELYLRDIKNELQKLNEDAKKYPNLSKEERSGLQNPINHENIIKTAGNGSATVTRDRKDDLKMQ